MAAAMAFSVSLAGTCTILGLQWGFTIDPTTRDDSGRLRTE